MYLYIDIETYSPGPPIQHGVYRYAAHAELLLLAWAVDDGPVNVWDATASPMPAELRAHFLNPQVTLVSHSAFDRIVLTALYPDLIPPVERWHDTSAQARAHALPAALADLCALFGVSESEAKQTSDGKQLVRLFCMPHKGQRRTRHTHPKEWARFVAYASHDVLAMRCLHRRMPTWNYPGLPEERRLYALDQRINDRGFCVDLALANGVIAAVAARKRIIDDRVSDLTGESLSVTQRDKLIEFSLREYGVALPDLTAATLERRIEDDRLDEGLRELLRLRLEAAQTGDTKYKALLRAVSDDGRLRGTTVYCGAARTGRWSGRTFQPQNLARVPAYVKRVYDEACAAFAAGIADLLYPEQELIPVASKLVRGALVAAPGKQLLVSDLSGIEGRILAWVAGESWKVRAFADYDRGVGKDIYVLAYARSFGLAPEDVEQGVQRGENWRDIGKVLELSMGYQGSVGAFRTMAAAYPRVPRMRDDEIVALVRRWRDANPAIRDFWYRAERAARTALRSPGRVVTLGRLRVRSDAAWLRIKLPSGRYLCYAHPGVDENDRLYYHGRDIYSHKWTKIYTYGGKLTENIVQAIARDVLREGMFRLEAAGYPIVLTVHDEVIVEAPLTGDYSVQAVSKMLATAPTWAPDLPLAAAGYATTRYRKG